MITAYSVVLNSLSVAEAEMEIEFIIMLKNLFRKNSSTLQGWRETMCKPGANNPELLQECQVLQLLCELGSVFPAGTVFFFFFTWMALWSPHLKPVLKVENGCGCHENIPGNMFAFFPIYLGVITNCLLYKSSHLYHVRIVGKNVKV